MLSSVLECRRRSWQNLRLGLDATGVVVPLMSSRCFDAMASARAQGLQAKRSGTVKDERSLTLKIVTRLSQNRFFLKESWHVERKPK